MNQPSVKKRFLASFAANGLRAALLFLAGLVVARSLGPENFGEFTFLTGSFMAIIQLLDMGTSSAFYTFLSQKKRGARFVRIYLLWQAVQLILPIIIIGLIFPKNWLDRIWLGHARSLVIMAFIAIFIKQQVWQTVTQMGESQRLTYRVQFLSVIVAATYLLLVTGAWLLNYVSLEILFGTLIAQYLLVFVLAYKWFLPPYSEHDRDLTFYSMYNEFRVYCSPLILYSWVGFGFTFADTWLLQSFGGSRQQGYYAIGAQLSMIGQIVTLALFQIIWKEIAEAYANGNHDRARGLYAKSARFIYMAVAVICIFFIPWSADIISMTTGREFIDGWPILAVMFVYPLFQCLNYITDAWLLATAQVKVQSIFGIVFMLVSMVSSYFMLAPATAKIPGLGLGGMGTAIKLLVLNIIYANVKIFWIARKHKWKYDWSYQIVGGISLLGLSYLAWFLVSKFTVFQSFPFALCLLVAFVIYIPLNYIFVWIFPGLAGLTRLEMRLNLIKVLNLGKRIINGR